MSASQNPEDESNSATNEKREALRRALADLELTPEQTSDDQMDTTESVKSDSRDNDLLGDVPPHHG